MEANTVKSEKAAHVPFFSIYISHHVSEAHISRDYCKPLTVEVLEQRQNTSGVKGVIGHGQEAQNLFVHKTVKSAQ